MTTIPTYLNTPFELRGLSQHEYLALCEFHQLRECHIIRIYAADGSVSQWGAQGRCRSGLDLRQAISERLKLGKPRNESPPAPIIKIKGWTPTPLNKTKSIFNK